MSMHVRGPLAKLWRGSVVNTLIRTVAVPVLLIHPEEPGWSAPPKDGFRRIAVALDGSELAEEALGYAAALATSPAAELILVSSVEKFGSHNIAVSSNPPQANPVRENSPDLDLYYERLCRQLHVPFEVKLVRDESPATAIIAAAEECGADVVAIATHGRSGLSRLLFGSVAEAVLQNCHMPVLVFRPVGVLQPATIAS
jgi:nucleotide-binding universal stress UspA family protein